MPLPGVVYIRDVSGNTASITSSGQLKVDASVTANISGQPVNISGATVIALISGQTVVASVTANSQISGQTVYFVNDGVNNVVSISGQTVVASVVTNISGQLVAVSGIVAVNSLPVISVSGNAFRITDDGVNNVVKISGQTVVANVVTNISGQTTYLPNDGVNNVVSISGQTVVASVTTNISGQRVEVSGQVIYFINDSVNNVAKISGQFVAVSGIVNIGNTVNVNTVSGSIATVSGQTVYLIDDSVNNKVKISGQLVAVSGIVNIGNSPTVLVSGQTVSVSGSIVANVSGNAVKVSGESIRHGIPTLIRTRALLQCSQASGGTQLLSGDVRKATLINAGVSGTVMYVGSTTDPPYSGFGAYLTWGNGITFEVNNFNVLRVCAFASGQSVSYIGEQY